jgi:hypothetical protein
MKDGHALERDGVRMTTVPRTLSDVARVQGALAGVVAGDQAVKRGLLVPGDFDVILRDCKMWKGIPQTKRMVPLLDGRADNPGESISRFRMIEHNVAHPELQYEVVTRSGRRYYLDFAWPDIMVAGEFDGKLKYTDRSVLLAEKDREDDLRADGWRFVRWGWDDMWGQSPRMIGLIRDAHRRAA